MAGSAFEQMVRRRGNSMESVRGQCNAEVHYRSGVANDNTKNMIKQAFTVIGQSTVPEWPGYDFTPTDLTADENANIDTQKQAFRGLLGNYHAAGPAYLLAQHRSLFGMQYISKIRVWSYTGSPWSVSEGTLDQLRSNMLLFVTNVPADDDI